MRNKSYAYPANRASRQVAPSQSRPRGRVGESDQSHPNRLKFLCGEEVQTYFATSGVALPTMRKLISKFKQYPKVKHVSAFADVPQNDYHIHILHYNSIDCFTYAATRLDEIFAGADIKTVLTSMNDELNKKVEYGDCMPFAGMQMPIPGGKAAQ